MEHDATRLEAERRSRKGGSLLLTVRILLASQRRCAEWLRSAEQQQWSEGADHQEVSCVGAQGCGRERSEWQLACQLAPPIRSATPEAEIEEAPGACHDQADERRGR